MTEPTNGHSEDEVPEEEHADVFPVPDFATGFSPAATIADTADALIEEHPDALGHLRNWAIDYLWKRKGGKSKRRNRMKGVQITGELLRHYAKKTFIVWLAADHVENANLSTKQVEALVFSALLELGEDPKRGGPMLIAPDFTGFKRELEAYGTWNPSLEALGDTMRQMGLFAGDPEAAAAPA